MSEAYVYHFDTVPAFPLDIPTDGRQRFSMTVEQAIVYRWLVKHRPHTGPFRVNFREIAKITITHAALAHERVQALVERGWLRACGHGIYEFVQPVRQFREARRG